VFVLGDLEGLFGGDLPIWDAVFVLGERRPFWGVTCPSGTLCLCLVTRKAFLGRDLPIWDTVFVLGDPGGLFGGDLPIWDTVFVLGDPGGLFGG
jgi:hypothetical protein